MATLNDIQEKIANIVDQSDTYPTQGGTDWNIRLDLINRAQEEWEQTYDWQVLYKELNTLTSQSTGNASISLPNDFRKLASFPKVARTDNDVDKLPQIRPQEKFRLGDSDDYCMILAGGTSGHVMYVNPPSLCSGASIFIPYYAKAASLVSPANETVVPDSNFLVQRTVAWLWEARGDERFPNAQAEAEKILARMLEKEVVPGEAEHNSVLNEQQTKYNFRWGRN